MRAPVATSGSQDVAHAVHGVGGDLAHHGVDAGATESRTRDRVAHVVLAEGPVTASEIAEQLGLTPAAVRRHLDALVDDGLARSRDPLPSPTRGRGRPARAYVLTDAGHASMSTAYDDLAASAMDFLSERLGPQAIEDFAMRRVAELEGRYAPMVDAAGDDLDARAQALADALAEDGYAASARPVGAAGDGGVQLCQGHCPVQQVATRFPQLCEAETEVFSRLLGVHVQRLSTLAGGAHVCTTHVPHLVTHGAVPHTGTRAMTSTNSMTSTSTTAAPGTLPGAHPRTPDGRNRS
jgi:predicted ArsR family transcriptional regulator